MSTEHQQFLAWHVGLAQWQLVVDIHKSGINCHLRHKQLRQATCSILNIRVNGASMIFGLVLWIIKASHRYMRPLQHKCLP
jgi:hypothetical protein